MNEHIFLDNLTVSIAAILTGKNKFFSRSVNSESFKALIENIEITLPKINSVGTFELEANSSIGSLDPAIRIEKWKGNDYPTIIYHHGNNERPFDYNAGIKNTFHCIFVKSEGDFEANLIVVRAPFHNNSLKAYQAKMVELINFMTMVSTSVKINELIIKEIRKQNIKPIITCGISLGGWVTNLHRSYFNTSTAYIPLLAGTYLGELFLKSIYQKLVGREALNQQSVIKRLLNFNADFEDRTEKNVFPVLAIYDQFIEFEIQKRSYGGFQIKSIEAGHVTGALKSKYFRKHVLHVLKQINI